MKILSQIKKISLMNVLLFIAGAVLSYVLPQLSEVLINKAAQYVIGIGLIITAVFYFNRSGQKLKFLLGGVIFSCAFQFLNSFSYFFTEVFGRHLLIAFLVTVVIFISFYFRKVRLIAKYLLAGIVFAIALRSVQITYNSFENRINNPFEWDFLCFYINGKVAIQGLNFYSPADYIKVYDQLEIPIPVDYGFYRETVEVAMQYFPQSIWLFLPLGLFNFMDAHLLWNSFLILFLILDIFLIKYLFFKDESPFWYLFIIPMFLFFYAVKYSITFSSYSFVMLFTLLMIWKQKNQNLIGFWLAVGIALKPIMLIFALYPLLRKKWKALLYMAAYTTIFLIATIIYFGPDIVFSFLTQNTVQNLPHWSYTDNVVQSLLPVILRLTHYDFTLSSPLFHPMFIALGAIISIVSFWIIYKLGKEHDELALAYLTIFTLIIYPSTLNHYFLLALPAIFFMMKLKADGNLKLFIPVILGASYYFMIIFPFVALMILITFLGYYAFIRIEKPYFSLEGLSA